MKYYLTEFIGTMFLTLTVTLAGRSDLAPLAVAFVLMIAVYTGGYISGAHYNPAVTIALALSRISPKGTIKGYILAQIAGSVVGALIARVMAAEILAPVPAQPIIFAALVAEITFTAFLCYTVLHTATRREPNQYYGLAIGGVLLVAAIIAGPISGAVLNPAIGIGAFLTQFILSAPLHPAATLLYIAGPITGAVLAAMVFGVQRES